LKCGVPGEFQSKRRGREIDRTVCRYLRIRVRPVRLRSVVVRTVRLGTSIRCFIRVRGRRVRRLAVVPRISVRSGDYRDKRQTYERRDGDWQSHPHAYTPKLSQARGVPGHASAPVPENQRALKELSISKKSVCDPKTTVQIRKTSLCGLLSLRPSHD